MVPCLFTSQRYLISWLAVWALVYLVLGYTYRVPADNFGPEISLVAFGLSLLALLSLAFGVLLASSGIKVTGRVVAKNIEPSVFFVGGVALSICAYVFFFLNMERFGGLVGYLHDFGDRGDRYLTARKIGNYPYGLTAYAAFVFFLSFLRERFKRSDVRLTFFELSVIFVAAAPFLCFFILEGDRTTLLRYLLLAGLLAVAAKQITPKTLGIGIAAILIVWGAGIVRTSISLGLQEGPVMAKEQLERQFSKVRHNIPNEFAAIASTTKFVVSEGESIGHLRGYSYKEVVFGPVPRRILNFFDMEKPQPLADILSERWARKLFTDTEKISTFSISISSVAEMYVTGGLFLVMIGHFVWGLFYAGLARVANGYYCILAGGLLLPLSFGFFRSEFRGVFSFLIQYSILIFFGLVAGYVYSKFFARKTS